MTPNDPLVAAIDRASLPWRGLTGLARCIGGLAGAVVVFALAAWTLRAGASPAPATLAAWVIAGAALCIGGWRAQRAMSALDVRHVGQFLEAQGNWARGALTTLLDLPAQGTSASLHASAQQRRAGEVHARAAESLSVPVQRERRSTWWGVGIVALSVIALAAARPSTGSARAVWHPVAAARALVAPVQLHARQLSVPVGSSVTLDVRALGHQRAVLYTRTLGESWHAAPVALDAQGNAVVTSVPLSADLVARVEAGGRRSRDVRVSVRVAAFIGDLVVTARYPAYLALGDEALPVTGDTLVVPEGTSLTLTGRATTALRDAWLDGPAQRQQLRVDHGVFRGAFHPQRTGTWRVGAHAEDGDSLGGALPSLPIRLIADSAPVVDIAIPGADTTVTSAPSLGVVIAIRDDHGITAAAIETRQGASGVVNRVAVPLPVGVGQRALVSTTVDLRSIPSGDTLFYSAIATDNAPTRHTGRSRQFMVRLPTAAEQQRARERATASTAAGFDSIARQSAAVQQAEQDLAREGTQAGGGGSGDNDAASQPMSNDAARQADAVAQSQQQVIDQAAALQRKIQQLRAQAQRAGATDSALARDLGDLDHLLDQALSPELRARLAALQQAIKSLDPAATQQALQQMAQQQALLEQAMAQARALFKRAALETAISSLAQTARQLSNEQHAAAADSTPGRHEQRAAEETRLAHQVDSLAAHVDSAADQVPASATRTGLRDAAQHARAAATQMRRAALSGAQSTTASNQAARQADAQLAPVAKQIADNGESMQAQMRAEAMQAIARALQETVRLAQRQAAIAAMMQQGVRLAQARTDQGVVDEGAAKVAEQVRAAAALNALVSPRAGIALAEARQFMLQAVAAIAPANPNLRNAYARAGDAVDALDVAAYSLLQSHQRVSGSHSGSGVAEALQQMEQMAARQGRMAQQGSAALQHGFGSAQQLMQMALQERALAQQLDRMRAGGQLPGAGELAQHAHDLSHDLESGQLNPDVVERQHRLFARMLDAGRTLQGEQDDESRERHAATAVDAPPEIPPALDARIRSGAGELHLPSWEALQRLQPDERRRVVDYFQRLTQTAARP